MTTATGRATCPMQTDFAMTDNTLDEEIDALAEDIESRIAQGEEILNEFDGEFDPKYRRMAEAKVNPAELFG